MKQRHVLVQFEMEDHLEPEEYCLEAVPYNAFTYSCNIKIWHARRAKYTFQAVCFPLRAINCVPQPVKVVIVQCKGHLLPRTIGLKRQPKIMNNKRRSWFNGGRAKYWSDISDDPC